MNEDQIMDGIDFDHELAIKMNNQVTLMEILIERKKIVNAIDHLLSLYPVDWEDV